MDFLFRPSSDRANSRHDWNTIEDYMFQHERRLEDYAGFINDYEIGWEYHDDPPILVTLLKIWCIGKLIITIEKAAEVTIGESGKRLQRLVKTTMYAYNVSIEGAGNILRYDNNHPHRHHETGHHRHVYHPPGIEVKGSPECLGDDWPHMHEVVEDCIKYYSCVLAR